MKKFLVLATVALFATSAFAVNNDTSPFQPEVIQRFKKDEATLATNTSQIATLQGGLPQIAVADYDFAVNGGAISTINLGVTLPAKALVKQVWFYVVTTPTSGGTPGVTLFCEDAGNLLASTDVTTWSTGNIKAGAATGTAATMVAAIAAQCNISLGIATATLTAGKFRAYIEYTLTP